MPKTPKNYKTIYFENDFIPTLVDIQNLIELHNKDKRNAELTFPKLVKQLLADYVRQHKPNPPVTGTATVDIQTTAPPTTP